MVAKIEEFVVSAILLIPQMTPTFSLEVAAAMKHSETTSFIVMSKIRDTPSIYAMTSFIENWHRT